MPEISLSDWQNYLNDYSRVHLLQTGEWGELKGGFGWTPVRIIDSQREAGAQILFRRLPLGYTVAYLPKGFADVPDGKSFWDELDRACRVRKAIFLKLELDSWESPSLFDQALEKLVRLHFPVRTSPHNIQPPRTLIVDIHDTEDEILAKMKQKTRYNIRLAGKKGVTVRAWDDIESFHKMMLLTGGRDGFGVHSLEYYRRAYELLHPKGMCEILVAEYDGRPLAALFVARYGYRAYYLYGASTDEERNRMPTYLLQWEAMKWAKARGCEEYDLWGVPDEDESTLEANFETRHDGLWGVYRFKRGFGGELKRAAQAMDRVYNPVLYWAYLRFIGNRE
jgi:lipid II:glycine glycyltransferase (peptidoglycan interpeptide bridge formation enzyme)